VKRILYLCLLGSLACACHQNRDPEGPMQRAGKSVDKAADKTGHALKGAAQKTGEAAGKAAKATGGALEKAGQKLKGDDAPAPSK
jgi:hypothetical protein